jgi:hypothetical protein
VVEQHRALRPSGRLARDQGLQGLLLGNGDAIRIAPTAALQLKVFADGLFEQPHETRKQY